MAEYIDRELTIKEWYKNSRLSKSARKIFKEIPTADVIERSRVDKAIEELQHIKVYEHTATARLVSLPEVLDVFKRNIGE